MTGQEQTQNVYWSKLLFGSVMFPHGGGQYYVSPRVGCEAWLAKHSLNVSMKLFSEGETLLPTMPNLLQLNLKWHMSDCVNRLH